MQSIPLLLQPESKRSLLTARLFPVAHPDALIGPVEVLWLAGILTDTSGATLNRCVAVTAKPDCYYSGTSL